MENTNKTQHPRNVVGYSGSLEDLAKAVGNMTYDQTATFLQFLADDISNQAEADIGRGRKKLASKLLNVSGLLAGAKEQMDKAWKICKPFM